MNIKANYYSLSPRRFIAGTKNSYGVETLSFEFSPEWDGLSKTVTFYPVKGDPVAVVYGNGPITVPAEVTKEAGLAKFTLSGCKNECSLISVTGYMDVLDALDPGGDLPIAPTPSEMSQVLTIMNAALETANSVRQDANNGVFKGEKGDKGDPGDPANIDEIAESVAALLPSADSDAINTLENVIDFEPVLFNDFLRERKWETTTPNLAYDEANINSIKLPCKEGEIYKISFKGAIPIGTPCFIKDESDAAIQYIYKDKSEPETNKEKLFTVAKGGKALVINYVNTGGIPHIYCHKRTDASVWGLPSYWFGKMESAKKLIELCQDKGKDVFTFAFITDTHTDVLSGGGFARILKHMLASCEIPLFLHGGDAVAGAGGIGKNDLIAEICHHKEIFKDIADKGLFALGNHDASYGVSSNYDGVLTEGEIYNALFRGNESKSRIVSGKSGRYFYKDNPVQKTRYIVLDSFGITDNPMTGASQMGNEQLNWLVNALNVESGYSIVLCSHIAPYRQADLDAVGWTVENYTWDSSAALGIVNAYRNRTSYSLSAEINGETYDISADFSGSKGNIVCWMAGHSHKDHIFDLDGLAAICTANCSSHVSAAPEGFAPSKAGGTDTEFIIDFVCVDRAGSRGSVIRLGASLDGDGVREFNCSQEPPKDSSESGDSGDTEPDAPSLISFAINGTEYQAEEGMTWGEWCESDYNTQGCLVSENAGDNGYKIGYGNGDGISDSSGYYVCANDTLLSGGVYYSDSNW